MSQPKLNDSKSASVSCSAIATSTPSPAQLPTIEKDDIISLCLEGGQEFFDKLVQESIIYMSDPICGEMVTKPSNSRIPDLIITWTSYLNQHLTSDERTIFDRLTTAEIKKLFAAVAKKARLPLPYYYNHGRKIAKDVGQISEMTYEVRMKALRDAEKRADDNGGYEDGEEDGVEKCKSKGKGKKRKRGDREGVDLLKWAGVT